MSIADIAMIYIGIGTMTAFCAGILIGVWSERRKKDI
jgi:hypothetical protein